MIEELFPSKSFYATFAVFFDYPNDPLHARLIARMTGCDIKCIHRQLCRLSGSGVIEPLQAGREKRYRLRPAFPLIREFTEFFRSTRDLRSYRGQCPLSDPLELLEDLLAEIEESGEDGAGE